MKRSAVKKVALYLTVIMFMIGLVPRAEAGFTPTPANPSVFERTEDLAQIQKVLETKIIRDRLERLGFSQKEIQARLNDMSSEQLHQLALALDDARVGGDGLGIVIALLVIAILVVLLLQLTGHKVIVK